jgi:carbonic anhydrase/acetyltransferase-like protein (isoleucine patch superfamily)
MPLYALDDARPELPASGRYWVAPGAQVMGRVRLGEDASIWFGAVLRGDNELIDIGARSNIQDGSVLHTDPGFPMVIGEDCTIGHKAILHGCVIGPGSLIGMGATILNGARIGAGCLVGANALILENQSYPDGSLIVGAPAKAIRTMAPEQMERLRATAAGYVRNHRRFAAGLKEVAPT